MPCLFGCLAVFFPRIVLALIFLFTDYLQRAFDSLLWPVLGFIFLPLTTLAYAFAINQHGSVEGRYFVLTVVAVLVDLGILGGGGISRRRKRD